MPEVGSPAAEQRLDFALASAIEDRGAEPDAVLHAGGDAQQLRVVEFLQLTEGCRVGELLGDRLADFVGVLILFDQLGDLPAEIVRGPAEVGFENLTDVHTAGNAEGIENDLDGVPSGR